MAVELQGKVEGIDKLADGLKGMRRTLAKRTLRKPLFTGMDLTRRTIAGISDVLQTTDPVKHRGGRWMLANKARKKGMVKRSVKTLWSKLQSRRGDAGVWVTITRPNTTKAQIREGGGKKKLAVSARRRGAFSYIRRDGTRGATYRPNDPFYFRFLEFGTKKMKPRPFIGRIARGPQGGATLRLFVREAVKAIEQLKSKDIT